MAIIQPRRSDVYMNEIDVSQTVTGASSSIAGLLVVSNQGSTEMQFFSDGQQFLNEFGIPNPRIGLDIYSGLDFFREGNEMWARRVVGSGALYSGLMMYQDADETKLAAPLQPVSNPEMVDFPDQVPPGTTPLALFYPRQGQGSYGDAIAISIQSTNVQSPDGSQIEVTSEATGGTLSEGTYDYRISSITPTGETIASPVASVVIAAVGSTYAVTVKWAMVPNAIGYRIYGRSSSGMGFMVEVGASLTPEWIDTGAVTPDTARTPITNPADAAPASPEFVVNVYDTSVSTTNTVESFVCTLEDMTDADGISSELEERINPFSQYIRVVSNAQTLVSYPAITDAARTNMAGGDSGTAPTDFDIAGAWASFANKNLYDVNLLINSGNAVPSVQLAMNSLAVQRQDAVALLDVPSTMQQAQQAVNYRNLDLNLNSSYSALFSPDVLIADTYNGKEQYVPFSGWAAALCARTDRVANPSFSIAGLNRGLVDILKTRYTYTDGEQNLMFRAQVNYTRTFIGQGTALWEQQTLQAKSSALSWLSVRRIVNVMKKSLLQFGLYVLQEPNDDFTRQQVVVSFSDYLETIKNARGISRYVVVCDASNNPDAYVNSGILRVTVVIVPILPVHELQVDFVVSKEGVAFTETLRSLYPS